MSPALDVGPQLDFEVGELLGGHAVQIVIAQGRQGDRPAGRRIFCRQARIEGGEVRVAHAFQIVVGQFLDRGRGGGPGGRGGGGDCLKHGQPLARGRRSPCGRPWPWPGRRRWPVGARSEPTFSSWGRQRGPAGVLDDPHLFVLLRVVPGLHRLVVDRRVVRDMRADPLHGVQRLLAGKLPAQLLQPLVDGRLAEAHQLADLSGGMARQGELGDLRQQGFLPLAESGQTGIALGHGAVKNGLGIFWLNVHINVPL